MIVMCAWCVPMRKLAEIEPYHDDSVSHGICEDCRADVIQAAHVEKLRQGVLDAIAKGGQ